MTKTFKKQKCTNDMKLRINKILNGTRKYECCGKNMRTTFKRYTDDICPHCEPELYSAVSNYLMETSQFQDIMNRREKALSEANSVEDCIKAFSSTNSFVLTPQQLLELEDLKLDFIRSEEHDEDYEYDKHFEYDANQLKVA